MYQCKCFIVPTDVLERFAGDKKLEAEVRQGAADSARVTNALRGLRLQHGELTNLSRASGAHLLEIATTPKVTVYDCKHSQTLPGSPVPNPPKSKDPTAKRAFVETTSVAKFYKAIFGRNS